MSLRPNAALVLSLTGLLSGAWNCPGRADTVTVQEEEHVTTTTTPAPVTVDTTTTTTTTSTPDTSTAGSIRSIFPVRLPPGSKVNVGQVHVGPGSPIEPT